MTEVTYEELIEILKAWSIVNDEQFLLRLLNKERTVDDYLKTILERSINKLPRFETDVIVSEKKLKESTNKDMDNHYQKWLERDKEGLINLRNKIRLIRKALQSYPSVEDEKK